MTKMQELKQLAAKENYSVTLTSSSRTSYQEAQWTCSIEFGSTYSSQDHIKIVEKDLDPIVAMEEAMRRFQAVAKTGTIRMLEASRTNRLITAPVNQEED